VRLTLLGTGTSFGVPQIGCGCRTCTSTDPKDRRGRTAALFQDGDRRILIDTPPELRLQLVAAGVDHLDAVLFTHAHADHVHGIDDLRAFTVRQKAPLDAYGSPETLAELGAKFPYIFDLGSRAPAGTSKPELVARALVPGVPVRIAGLEVEPLSLPHGRQDVLAFRIGRVAYVTDVKDVPRAAQERLHGLEVLVLSALLSRPHPLHLSIPEAVTVAQAIGARHTFFTHLTHETPHAELAASLPAGITPAYDGLVIDVGES
jgi:phosphoribosyl 1,2-cyclic phosphate phosphodiesterase